MKNNKFSLTVFMVAFLGLAISMPVSADVSYAGYYWQNSNVNWYHNNSTLPSGWVAAIKSARSTWTSTGASISLTSMGNTNSTNGSGGRNVWYGNNYGNNGNTAYTYVTRNGMSVLDVDTYINTYYSFSTTGSSNSYDVQDVATHEWGHWLVLQDDRYWEIWDNDNTMYEVSSYGSTTRRTLTSEDIAAILSIY